ncbi:uncharacterized protein LOC143253033 isoform X1 [Tachypleus tridentatus]|uniref:uncharacterized protein LOC143253033 isoform X1 n=1 Tax=Tachypleus tridentatus TaxID=6853 RepID=UPI003FD4D230
MDKCSSLKVMALMSLVMQDWFRIPGFATQCYICSWSPNDRNNQTDRCTDNNFNGQKVYSHECDHGCETFVQWDSNGNLEHWRRNCVSGDIQITKNCEVTNKIAWKRRICTCNLDYCNRESRLSGSLAIILTLMTLQKIRQ